MIHVKGFRSLVRIAVLLFAPAGVAAEGLPAVDEINGEVGLGYSYADLAEGTSSIPGLVLTASERTAHGPVAYARITVPLTHSTGVRVSGVGALADSEIAGSADQSGSIDSFAELFWRDPEAGEFAVGYHYGWLDLPFSGQTNSHGFTVAADIFFPDLGTGVIDWGLRFGWDRIRLTGPGISGTTRAYSVGAEPRWYITDTVLIAPSVDWARSNASSGGDRLSEQIVGALAVEWLVGFGTERFVSLGVGASYGQLTIDGLAPFPAIDQRVYSVGGKVSFYFRPISSLRQYRRERR